MGLSACSPSIDHVLDDSTVGNKLTVSVSGGCPASLGGADDVTKSPAAQHDKLIPANASPTQTLICEYANSQLKRHILLAQDATEKLASAISKISLKPPSGSFNCPAEFFGDDTVIAFGYPLGRTVDLWYTTSGCETLDNGDVLASQGANPSFYSGFQDAFAALTSAA